MFGRTSFKLDFFSSWHHSTCIAAKGTHSTPNKSLIHSYHLPPTHTFFCPFLFSLQIPHHLNPFYSLTCWPFISDPFFFISSRLHLTCSRRLPALFTNVRGREHVLQKKQLARTSKNCILWEVERSRIICAWLALSFARMCFYSRILISCPFPRPFFCSSPFISPAFSLLPFLAPFFFFVHFLPSLAPPPLLFPFTSPSPLITILQKALTASTAPQCHQYDIISPS